MTNPDEIRTLTPLRFGADYKKNVYDIAPVRVVRVEDEVPKDLKGGIGQTTPPAETSSSDRGDVATIPTPSSPTPSPKEQKESSSASDVPWLDSASSDASTPDLEKESGAGGTDETETSSPSDESDPTATPTISTPTISTPTTPTISKGKP